MDKQYWHQRWLTGNTPWRYPEANRELERCFDELAASCPKKTAFVPLCGDSPALRFLREGGFSVVGLEMLPEAVARLKETEFPELTFAEQKDGALLRSSAPRVTLLTGNIFDFDAESEFGLVYDRAALVALPADKRAGYARIIERSLVHEGILFVVSYEYELTEYKEPPFSVPLSEIKTIFPGLTVEQVEERELPEYPPHMAASSSPPKRVTYILRKK